MCGIAGQVDYSGSASPHLVEHMIKKLQHRGPDANGIWESHDSLCALGHARLSVIDLSDDASQPMEDNQKNYTIVFNGEIYNFSELRIKCELKGYKFRSQSDTETILALYNIYGPDTFEMLRGMFSIAIWDIRRKELIVARDRLGKKPFNYSYKNGCFIFSSEISPLASLREIDKEIDQRSLELYFQTQSIPAPYTIYREIRKLPPAHFAVVNSSGMTIKKYWDISYTTENRLKESEVLDAFEEKLTESIKLRMISDVPLGALLSGGVDSSVIVAIMSKISSSPINTFSIGFEEAEYSELKYADFAAKSLGTHHHARVVKSDIESLLPKLASHYGEPFADSSAIPSFIVSSVAREEVTVVLNGDGGDELLGGYPRYSFSGLSNFLGKYLGSAIGPTPMLRGMKVWQSAQTVPEKVLRKVARKSIYPEIGSLTLYDAHWHDEQRKNLLPQGAENTLAEWRQNWFDQAYNNSKDPINRMLWVDSKTYLADVLLPKMDIASMHTGLEARSPFLDHELIEFCAHLPSHFKVRNQVGKYLLKQLAERYFPSNFVYRKKMGFGIPVAKWLANDLKSHVEEIIFDDELMYPLSSSEIQKQWKSFLNGKTTNSAKIWDLLMYGHWKNHSRSL